jgi:predicted polyphosphate/ATP-dependent NAD kinase
VLTIGIVANPSSGKDIRRLVGKASVFDNREKQAIVRRAVVGAVNAGAQSIAFMDDSHSLASCALSELSLGKEVRLHSIACPRSATALDTVKAAQQMRELPCAAVLVLGGDGTNRAFVKGWRDATLLSLSTGTNNVFPVICEATVAGSVLGLLASGALPLDEVTWQTKIIDVRIEDEADDLALIDAVFTSDSFIGSRALLDADVLIQAVLSRADPMAVGMTSLGGLIEAIDEQDEAGLHIVFGPDGRVVSAPIAPGLFASVGVKSIQRIDYASPVEFKGPAILALDGERERVIGAGQKVELELSRTGPKLVDISKAMQLAAERGLFIK